jgi:signal transduction histidine kinase
MRFEVQQQAKRSRKGTCDRAVETKFFTNVSHEFRTPLSLIISPLETIIKNATDEEQKQQLNLVQRNAKRLLNLVTNCLISENGSAGNKITSFHGDIIAFSEDISHSFTDIAEKKNIKFSFSSNIDSLEIYFDKDKIEKILFNLLSNAFKYTHDGGEVSINLHYTQPINNEGDGKLAIEVKDTGIGIPAEMHERSLNVFFKRMFLKVWLTREPE